MSQAIRLYRDGVFVTEVSINPVTGKPDPRRMDAISMSPSDRRIQVIERAANAFDEILDLVTISFEFTDKQKNTVYTAELLEKLE